MTNRRSIGGAFRGVYGRGSIYVLEARQMQLEGEKDKALPLYKDALAELDKKRQGAEQRGTGSLQSKACLAETKGLIALIKGTVKEIEAHSSPADFERSIDDFEQAKDSYLELETALVALAKECEPGIVKTILERESKEANEIYEAIKEELLGGDVIPHLPG